MLFIYFFIKVSTFQNVNITFPRKNKAWKLCGKTEFTMNKVKLVWGKWRKRKRLHFANLDRRLRLCIMSPAFRVWYCNHYSGWKHLFLFFVVGIRSQLESCVANMLGLYFLVQNIEISLSSSKFFIFRTDYICFNDIVSLLLHIANCTLQKQTDLLLWKNNVFVCLGLTGLYQVAGEFVINMRVFAVRNLS